MRVLSKYLWGFSKTKLRNTDFIRRFMRSCPRCLSGDYVVDLNEQTITGRILTYLNNENNKLTTNKKVISNIRFFKNIKDTNFNVQKFDIQQLISTFHFLTSQNCTMNENDFKKLLHVLDEECCSRLPNLKPNNIFELLNLYMKIVPNRITEYNYYQKSLIVLKENIGELSQKELLKFLFYIGLQKKSEHAQRLIRLCLKHFQNETILQMTTEDLCVICNSTFKTSTKITNNIFLKKIRNHLNDNLKLLEDSAMLVTFLKTLRHNRFQDEDLLETLTCTIFFNKTYQYYSFLGMCHILAMYSDFLYFDEELFDLFTKKCINELEDSAVFHKYGNVNNKIRVKDIKRFLWCLSNVNYKKLDIGDIKQIIIPKIIERIEAGEFQYDPGSLVDIILYLWMLNYRAYEIVPYAFTKQNMQIIMGSKSHEKLRLNLLISCIHFEDNNLFKSLSLKRERFNDTNLETQLKYRPQLERVFQNLKSSHSKMNFEIGCVVPFLNIAGIIGYTNKIYKSVYIEVLDDYSSVKNVMDDRIPSGLMQLKLRILNGLEEGLVVIDSVDIECMTEAKLQESILDEIELVC